jgi:hypothetical protein
VQLNKHTTPTPWEFAGDTRLTEYPQDRCDGIPFSEYHCHLQLRSHKSCAFMDFGQLRVRRLAAVSLFPWFPSRPFSLHYFRPGTLQIVTVSPVAITAVSPRTSPQSLRTNHSRSSSDSSSQAQFAISLVILRHPFFNGRSDRSPCGVSSTLDIAHLIFELGKRIVRDRPRDQKSLREIKTDASKYIDYVEQWDTKLDAQVASVCKGLKDALKSAVTEIGKILERKRLKKWIGWAD